MRQKLKKQAGAALAMVMLLTLLQCGKRTYRLDPLTNEEKGTVAIKNFREYAETLSSVMQVVPDQELNFAIFSTATRLSSDGNVTKVSPAMLLAATTLSSVFCKKWITKAREARVEDRDVFRAVDFNKGVEALTPAVRADVIQRLAMALWLREPSESEMQDLTSMLDSIAKEGEADGIMHGLISACTAIASSLDALQS